MRTFVFAALAAGLVTLTPAAAHGAARSHGDATYFHVGLGSCGAYSVDTDYVVALSSAMRAQGHCWQHITVAYQGRQVDATVVDTCPGCAEEGIDLSPAAFQALAPLEAGRIQVDWWFN
jgi:expansin (peptidoglycan-binding protein)